MEVPGIVPPSTICPSCKGVIPLEGREGLTHVDCPHCGAPTVVPVEFRGFLLLHALGFGGMGTVYRAMDLSLNRMLAIKILRRKLASSNEFLENFRREAQAAAAVNHNNVARVFSFGHHEGQCYLVMELLERGSLDDRLTKIGKVPEKEVLDIGIQIANGLKAALDTGLLHRDVKPGNILFNEQGVPKIVDFGLARPKDADHQAGSSAEPVWGTPYYIAPEKLTTHTEDFRSDIYSLGATLFHAMTGRPPFDAATAVDVAVKHTTTPAYSLKTYLPTVQDATAQVIGRMIAKNPSDRYESYDALIADLEKTKKALEEAEKKPAILTQTGERISVSSIILTVVGLLAIMVAGVFLWLNRDKFLPEQPAPAPQPVVTQQVVRTTVKTEDVNFNNIPGWRAAAQQLAEGKMTEALLGYGALQKQKEIRSQPNHLRWLHYAEGVGFLLNNQSKEASESFAKAEDSVLQSQLPSKITAINFVSPLAGVMLKKLPQASMDKAADMPRWAVHLSDFNAGLFELRVRHYTNAAPRFTRYAKATPNADHRWMYAFQPLAAALARECSAVPQAINHAGQLYKQGDLPEALKSLKEQQAKTQIPFFKAQLGSASNALRQRDEELRKRQQQERLAAETREREQQQQRQLEQQRKKQEADEKLIAAVETEAPKLLAAYDFKKLLEDYQAIQSKLQTAGARARLARHLARLKTLAELKRDLAAAFARQPFNGEDIKQPGGAAFIGKLTRATDTELGFVVDFGDSKHEWGELQPATIVMLAAFYARTEKTEQQALWYFRIAVFCKQYALDRFVDAYAQEAIKLQPSLEAELNNALGK
ncbi:MAG: serine/threonine protein kinase [Verrucomicrobia bacterium]|nr:serine/threonine protein kinase [Verrucomicrobiota bacterium]